MPEPLGVWCGPDKPPKGKRGEHALVLNAVPSYNNVHLKIANISRRLAKEPPSLVLDLLEIASYVYSGDQCFTRGGLTLPGDGASWRRDFCYNIPVRNISIWERPDLKSALIDLLSFLSDDYYELKFRPLHRELPTTGYFEFDNGEPWFDAEEIMLFSGGLDSFAGLCDTVLKRQKNVVLVSHRSAPQTDAVQRSLLEDFRNLTGSGKQFLHIPVWVNKSEHLTKDTHQRTRSFLYASLAASLAHMHKCDQINFYENGITSCNLIASESTKGARASRTTHPKALHGMADLFSLLFEKEFKVKNPFFWKTKADVVRVIQDHQMQGLIRYATSCSHVRSGDPINNHCGVCSQCVGRRLAIVYNGLELEDPEEMYKVKLPIDPIPKDIERIMPELLVKTAREFEQSDVIGFYRAYSIAASVVAALSGKADENARGLAELHRKHGRQVCEVLERFVESNRGLIARGDVPENSLLGMIVGSKSVHASKTGGNRKWDLPKDIRWEDITIEIVGLDAAKILVRGQTYAASTAEMGFEDRRKKAPNRLWDLLVEFAEANGSLTWSSRERSREWKQKDFQRLRTGLRSFFGVVDDPFMPYHRETGYRTRFRILYDHTVRV